MSDMDELTMALWDAAESVPNDEKDEFWMAADLRVRIMALCKVVDAAAHAAGVAAERARWVEQLEMEIEGAKGRVRNEAGALDDIHEYASALALYFGLRRIVRRLSQ